MECSQVRPRTQPWDCRKSGYTLVFSKKITTYICAIQTKKNNQGMTDLLLQTKRQDIPHAIVFVPYPLHLCNLFLPRNIILSFFYLWHLNRLYLKLFVGYQNVSVVLELKGTDQMENNQTLYSEKEKQIWLTVYS